MKRAVRLIWAGVLVMGLCSCGRQSQNEAGGGAALGGGAPAARKLVIAVIPKGTTHVFWKSVEAGARKAADELGVEIRWKGPIKENDRAQQIQVMEQFISEGVDGIVLAPLDDEALQPACRTAMNKGIPVVIFDSALKGQPGRDFISFVATNNRKGGALAGERMVKKIGEQAGLVLLRYQVGSASTTEREEGFLEGVKGRTDCRLLSDNQYGGPTVGDSIQVAENLLDVLKQAQGVFAPNESTSVGMLTTLQRHNLAGKIRFVGFDASAPLIAGLRAGEIDALVVQNPRKMGYLGVLTAVDHLRNVPVEQNIDTGVALVTRDNLETDEIKHLLE